MARFEAKYDVVYDSYEDRVVHDVGRAYPHVPEPNRVLVAQRCAFRLNQAEQTFIGTKRLMLENEGVL